MFGKLMALFILLFCITAQAQETTVVERKVILTPAPKSVNCTEVAAHWEGNTWVDTQTICKYQNRVEGVAWVQSYWACTVSDPNTGECTTWQYQPGHWLKTYP